MHRLLAIAKYDERYVIPTAHAEQGAAQLEELDAGARWTTRAGRAWAAGARSARPPAGPTPIAVENFHMLRQPADQPTRFADPATKAQRVNLLNWDGKGAPAGPVPAPRRTRSGAGAGEEPSRERASPPRRDAGDRPAGRSLLLGYPDEELLGRLPLLRAAAADRCRPALAGPLRPVPRPPGGRRRWTGSRPSTSRPSTCAAAAACT